MPTLVDDIASLVAGRALSYGRMRRLFEALDETDRLEESRYVTTVVALMAKRPTVEELSGIVDDVAARSIDLTCSLDGFGPLVDISGSGGDAMDTPNVGSLASFVAAAGGLPVAKQATRSFTGITGSADVFALLGLDVMAANLERSVDLLLRVGVTAMHTPSHCDRFARRMAVLRRMRELDLRIVTPWHLAAWMYSPFPLTGRVYGVFDESYRRQVAQVMQRRFPEQHVLVVRGREGIDEISVCGITDVTEVKGGRRRDFTLSPSGLGLPAFSPAEVSAHEPEDFRRLLSPDLAPGERAAIRRRTAARFPEQVFSILSGRGRPAHEALVAANAGAALYVGGQVDSLEEGTSRALRLLRDGSVWRLASTFARTNGDAAAVKRLAQLSALGDPNLEQFSPDSGLDSAPVPAARAITMHVSVPVLDLAEAERFYCGAFGARTLVRSPRLTTMDVAGQRLALRQVEHDSPSLQRNGRDGLRARHFGFGVSTPVEVDAASERLPALGATVVVGPSDRADGRSAVFCDQSGNQLEVYFQETSDG